MEREREKEYQFGKCTIGWQAFALFSGFIQYYVECQNIHRSYKVWRYILSYTREIFWFISCSGRRGEEIILPLFFFLTLSACVILCYNKSIHLIFSNSLVAVASPLLRVTYDLEEGHETYTFPRPQHVRSNIQIQFQYGRELRGKPAETLFQITWEREFVLFSNNATLEMVMVVLKVN